MGDLLHAEITEKQARSVKYQMTIAKLPLAKEINEFDFETADVNETLIRDLATGNFLDHQRNLVLIGGTGTGKDGAPPVRGWIDPLDQSRDAPHPISPSALPALASEKGDGAGSSTSSIW